MSAVAGPLHVSSLLRTMALAPPSRERHHAARQLASLDPRQFLANIQLAASNRSPHAIASLKADMDELDDIFHKLSRAGHDVSAAQRDFQMLQTFVSQLSNSTPSQPEKQRHTSHHQHHHQHHRTASVPSSSPSSSRSSSAMNSRPRSNDHNHTSTRQGQQHQAHQAQAPKNSSSRSTWGHSPTSTSSSSSTSSSRNSANINANSNATVWSPTPHRLIKPRRASVPPDPSPSSTKKVHFATHATVYTINSERGRSASSLIVPPSRPACIPRVDGRVSTDSRSRF